MQHQSCLPHVQNARETLSSRHHPLSSRLRYDIHHHRRLRKINDENDYELPRLHLLSSSTHSTATCTCSTYIRNYGSVTASIIALFLFYVLSLVMWISTVWSRSARQFWRRRLLGLVRCCRKPILRGNSVEDTNER